MNYIINPNWFYWLQVIDGLNAAFEIIAGVAIFAFAVLAIISLVNYFAGTDYRYLVDELGRPTDSEWRSFLSLRKVTIIFAVIAIVSLIISIFIPPKETLISMMIAKYATKENLDMTVDGIKSAVDYIVNAMKEIKG